MYNVVLLQSDLSLQDGPVVQRTRVALDWAVRRAGAVWNKLKQIYRTLSFSLPASQIGVGKKLGANNIMHSLQDRHRPCKVTSDKQMTQSMY